MAGTGKGDEFRYLVVYEDTKLHGDDGARLKVVI